jgi:hypothetical protein
MPLLPDVGLKQTPYGLRLHTGSLIPTPQNSERVLGTHC